MVRLAACFSILAAPADACRLALVLALDVSSSVDASEDILQRGGMAQALLAPEVQDAFFLSPDPVALAVFEWSGRYNQQDILDWRLIESPDDLVAAAEIIAGSTRSHDDFPTAMGHALAHGALKLRDAPSCLFKTIDLSADGINNDGFGAAEAYAAFPFDGVTVNGLAVNAADFEGEVNLISFFESQVLRGPGAFLEIATGFADFEDAMKRKLIRELSAMVIGGMPTAQGG